MSYYQYYQQQPQWGTSGYQVVAPPRPYFQPQPNWGGRQYFQAQIGGLSPDYYDDIRDELSSIWKSRGRSGRRWLGRRSTISGRGFFDSVWRGLKDVFSRGFAREDAALWHRRVYGGQVPVDELDAAQIGAAAGYEAIRHWQTYGTTYRSPLADDRDREKEALAGLAAGEAIKLLSYSGRRRHSHTRREAAETAAATAERIYAEDFDDPYGAYESNPYGSRRRRGSFMRRRSSSFYETDRPVVASTTGGYVSAQPTGASYVSAGTPGVQYVSAGTTGYAQPGYVSAQPSYVSATGQPVQYVQAGTPYAQPTTILGGQPVQYGTPGVTYATTGQTYATTGQTYATTGQPYQQAYVTGGTQYVQPTGYAQPQYVTGQTTGYLGQPQGYTRVRSLSTGGYAAPQVMYR